MLARAREPLLAAAATIRDTVTASPVVCSDETSARVSGKTWWEWVFIGTLAVLHIIRPSRGKAVVTDLFEGHPSRGSAVSDMLGSQRGHWPCSGKVCLAHLLRDARYAIECGDTAFEENCTVQATCCCGPSRHRTTTRGADGQHTETIPGRSGSPARSHHGGRPTGDDPGRKLRKRIAANRAHLFVFVTNRDVPYTNNISERHLRPSVIFRKVTNGFRCVSGAETYAASAPSSAPQRQTTPPYSTSSASSSMHAHPCTTSPRWGEQLRTWESYFPKANIIGVDISPATKRFEIGRIKIVLADQSNVQELVVACGKMRSPRDHSGRRFP